MSERLRSLAESSESMARGSLEQLPLVKQDGTFYAFQAVLNQGSSHGFPALVTSFEKGLSYAGRFSPFPETFGPNRKRFGTIDYNSNHADDYVVLHELGHMVVELTRGFTPVGRDCEHLAEGAAIMLAYLYQVTISDADKRIRIEPGGVVPPKVKPVVHVLSLWEKVKDWWKARRWLRGKEVAALQCLLGTHEKSMTLAIEFLGAKEFDYEYRVGDMVVCELISGHWFWGAKWNPFKSDSDCEMVREKLSEHDINLLSDVTNEYACKLALQLVEELK